MPRQTDDQIADRYDIPDVADRFGPFCTHAYRLSNRFKCHSCEPVAEAVQSSIAGGSTPRYRLKGLDSRQQAYDISGTYMRDALVAFAREMAIRYARVQQQQRDNLGALLDTAAARRAAA